MEKKIIIKKVKSWAKTFLFTILVIVGAASPWIVLGKIVEATLKVWHEGNLLYIPDLMELLGGIFLIVIGSLYAIVSISIILITLGCIAYKLYAYFVLKRKYTLQNLINNIYDKIFGIFFYIVCEKLEY